MAQEVLTPEDAKLVNEYRDSLAKYFENQRSHWRNICLLGPLALLLWGVSFLASGLAGTDSPRGYWLIWFAFASFVGACLISIIATVVAFDRNLSMKPLRPHTLDQIR